MEPVAATLGVSTTANEPSRIRVKYSEAPPTDCGGAILKPDNDEIEITVGPSSDEEMSGPIPIVTVEEVFGMVASAFRGIGESISLSDLQTVLQPLYDGATLQVLTAMVLIGDLDAFHEGGEPVYYCNLPDDGDEGTDGGGD